MKRTILHSAKMVIFGTVILLSTAVSYAACPTVTVSDPQGIVGKYRQQFELSEFQSLANCKLAFKGNPNASKLNSRIVANPKNLPSLKNRLPLEPLVSAPYDRIGSYGGVLDMISNATESGTSDFLSVRHVNLVRYSDDLKTIVPMIAKDWKWNADFTQLTFFLRKGHKWSDGAPFTAEDVKFWYDNLALDSKVIEKPKDYVLVAGERMTIDAVNETTVRFNLPSPKPGLLAHFATTYAQAFQPKHFLGQFHPDVNANADKLAMKAGFKNGLDVIKAYFGNSDWTDTASPLLNSKDKIANLPADVMPTLESHITVAETTEGRHFVANPYFFMVDTAGNQLPYISELDEVYANDHQVRLLKMINGEIDYKAQSLALADAPLLLENQAKGDYTIDIKPGVNQHTFTFNVTSEDPVKRSLFGDFRFRKAMSIAMNRDELNEVAYFGQGTPHQYTGFTPLPDFIDQKWKTFATEYDPNGAKELLAEVGMKDVDGDGILELPDGSKYVMNLQFATQGLPTPVAELVAQYWTNVGVKTNIKEVTPDEFRSAQSANQLDVLSFEKGQPLAVILGNNKLWIPPFDGYFDLRTGMLWGEYIDTKGASGVKPPAYTDQLLADINAFQSTPVGTAKSDEIGNRLVATMTSKLLFIGTVQSSAPIYHRNAVKNFTQFKTASYDYYRTFPYRPFQWFIEE
jgi:peptide/nickel transport system substrate-binding protein